MARPPILTENDFEIIKSLVFKNMIDKRIIQSMFSVSVKTSERILNKLGIDHVQQHLIDITKKYFDGRSVLSLVDEYKVSQVAIHAFFRRRGFSTRHATYILNHDYFEKIDSEEKAYFLGFIYADGCVYKNRLRISLSCVDTPILNNFSELIGSNKPILFRAPGLASFKNSTYSCTMELVSNKLISDLEKLGVVPNKTIHCDFPKTMISNPFLRDFMRGMVDGDGCLSKWTHYKGYIKYGLNICGTQNFLDGMRSVFSGITDSKGSYTKRRPESENCCMTLCYSGGETIKTMVKYLYENSTIHLTRKYEKYLEIIA